MYSMIGVNLVHIALINIYPNNVNVGLSTIISLSYISHIYKNNLAINIQMICGRKENAKIEKYLEE